MRPNQAHAKLQAVDHRDMLPLSQLSERGAEAGPSDDHPANRLVIGPDKASGPAHVIVGKLD
jgi:hypothetical protein